MNMSITTKNRGWLVAISGTCINLALGVLYTWSIFKEAIKTKVAAGEVTWGLASLNDPYSTCILFIAIAMIIAGKMQDKFGPKLTSLLGGVLVGTGFILMSQTYSLTLWVLGFGVMVGGGIGFSYSAATPAALKWFPPKKTGLIAGIVVSGLGLAAVYIAPLAKHLLGAWGLQQALLFFGIAFLVIIGVFSMFLLTPSKNYTNLMKDKFGGGVQINDQTGGRDYTVKQIVKQPTFYLLWIVYFIGAGAGLMVIGSVAGMAKKSLGESAFLVVAFLAIGNAGGRIVAGSLSDKIGRNKTLMLMFLFQALLMFISIPIMGASASSFLLVLLSTLIGFNYGTNFSLFPSFTKDLWGLKNLGMNYGLVFTAWGVGGAIMSRFSQMLKASTGSYTLSFIISGVLLIIGAGLTLVIKKIRS